MTSLEKTVVGAVVLVAAVFAAGVLAIAQLSGPVSAVRAIVVAVVLVGANAWLRRPLKAVEQGRPLLASALTGFTWGLTAVLAQLGFGRRLPWWAMLIVVAAMTLSVFLAATFSTRLAERSTQR
jgi:hypothetical protein